MRKKEPGAQILDSHLASDADTKSKPMIGLGRGNRPFLGYLLFNALEDDYRGVRRGIGEGDASIRDYYGVGDQRSEMKGIQISCAVQPIPPGRTKPLGTADALLHGLLARRDWRPRHVTVCHGNNWYSQCSLQLLLEDPSGCAFIDYDRNDIAKVQTYLARAYPTFSFEER